MLCYISVAPLYSNNILILLRLKIHLILGQILFYGKKRGLYVTITVYYESEYNNEIYM